MKEQIVTIKQKKDEKFLREKTKEFDIAKLKDKKQAKEVRELIRKMREIMKQANGVGLSANQIGIPERFFVAQVPDGQGHQKFLQFSIRKSQRNRNKWKRLKRGV